MANKNKTNQAAKPASKEQKKAPANSRKKTTTPPPAAPAKEETVVIVSEEETPAQNIVKAATSRTRGSLDANRRMDMLTNMRVMFHDDPKARETISPEVCDAMDHITRIGLICALADEAMHGDSTFAVQLKSSQYPALIVAANELGITLPSIKALPEEAGVVTLPSSEVKVNEEAKEQLENEHEIEQKGDNNELELDPKKIAHMSEDDLKKALTYHLITGPKNGTIKDMLVGVVDFMTEYRMELARQAQNSTDAMNKYADRTMREWLQDIFSYVKPTYLMKGIGKGMKALVVRDKSPISAFLILRNALIDKKTGVVVWDDQSIADATYAIIELICNDENTAEQNAIDQLDPKKKDYKEMVAKHQSVIDTNNEILDNINNISFDIVDKMSTSDAAALSVRGRVWTIYYPTADTADAPLYKNLNENLIQRAGIILNLFRNSGDQNQLYSESNLTEIEKYTLEEYEAIKAEQKKAEFAAKKESSKND